MKTLTVGTIVLLLAGAAMGQSQIAFTLELGGNNHVADWENVNLVPITPFTNGDASEGQIYTKGTPGPGEKQIADGILTWDVVAAVSGIHSGDSYDTQGIANMVFNLVLKDGAGSVVADTAWMSTMNDGDDVGARDQGDPNPEPLEKAAWCFGWDTDLNNDGILDHAGLPPSIGVTGRLFDPVGAGGPYMDRVQFPSVVGFGGGHMSGGAGAYVPKGAASPPDPTKITAGELLGMGIGYSQFVLASNGFGIGLAVGSVQPQWLGGPPFGGYVGVGAEPAAEGQIDLNALPEGTYTLELTAPPEAQNIILGSYDPNAGTGGFAARVDSVVPDTVTFYWKPGTPPPQPVTPQSWKTVRTHTGKGDLAISLNYLPGSTVTSEPRNGGLKKLVIRFDVSLTAGQNYTGNNIGISGPVGSTLAVLSQTITSSGGAVPNDQLEVVFTGTSTDRACYSFNLTPAVVLAVGADPTCSVITLVGDANGDRATSITDVNLIRARNGQDVTVGTNMRCDLNADGAISVTDANLCRARNYTTPIPCVND